MKRNHIHILLAAFLVIMTVVARVINANMHMPNMVPIAAIGLFCGAIMKENRLMAFLVPLLGQFLADVYFQLFTTIPGFYDLAGELFNYGALIACAALGTSMKRPQPATAFGYIAGGSALFFLLSNFGYFAQGWNGHTLAGLQKTYLDAIPFSKFIFMADMAGGVLLFGGYFLVQERLAGKAEKARA